MAKRKNLSKKTRFEVFKRDGFTCVYCGATPPKVVLHCDHVVAVANGGANDIDNLVTACDACNMGKGARELTVAPATVKAKAEALQEKEEQITAYNALVAEKQRRIAQTAWIVADVFNEGWGNERGKFNAANFSSIERFVGDLSLDVLIDAARRAISKRPAHPDQAWKYFCGTCWNIIRSEKE